jgi:hypothetical protein
MKALFLCVRHVLYLKGASPEREWQYLSLANGKGVYREVIPIIIWTDGSLKSQDTLGVLTNRNCILRLTRRVLWQFRTCRTIARKPSVILGSKCSSINWKIINLTWRSFLREGRRSQQMP